MLTITEEHIEAKTLSDYIQAKIKARLRLTNEEFDFFCQLTRARIQAMREYDGKAVTTKWFYLMLGGWSALNTTQRIENIVKSWNFTYKQARAFHRYMLSN